LHIEAYHSQINKRKKEEQITYEKPIQKSTDMKKKIKRESQLFYLRNAK